MRTQDRDYRSDVPVAGVPGRPTTRDIRNRATKCSQGDHILARHADDTYGQLLLR